MKRPHRFQLVPHHWSLAPDSLERNRWQAAAYGAAFAADGRITHPTAKAAAAEGRRLEAVAGFRWWIFDAAGKVSPFPASGSVL